MNKQSNSYKNIRPQHSLLSKGCTQVNKVMTPQGGKQAKETTNKLQQSQQENLSCKQKYKLRQGDALVFLQNRLTRDRKVYHWQSTSAVSSAVWHQQHVSLFLLKPILEIYISEVWPMCETHVQNLYHQNNSGRLTLASRIASQRGPGFPLRT